MLRYFKIIGKVEEVWVIASGRGIRELNRLKKIYGGLRWRKLKGKAFVKLADGSVLQAEIHWYEEVSVGRKEIKIKRFL
jgi:hypothetical protein